MVFQKAHFLVFHNLYLKIYDKKCYTTNLPHEENIRYFYKEENYRKFDFFFHHQCTLQYFDGNYNYHSHFLTQ